MSLESLVMSAFPKYECATANLVWVTDLSLHARGESNVCGTLKWSVWLAQETRCTNI